MNLRWIRSRRAPGVAMLLAAFAFGNSARARDRSIGGIHPHLAMFNEEAECGTGAVVPWAGRLWVITYGPHLPYGSSDRLYEITPDLVQIVRPESVGGTHANRLVHRESGQLFIGPYAIDRERKVRVIPPARMPGRLTGTARHLVDPAGRVYFATMEEGLYEVDVRTLAVRCLIRDGNRPPAGLALDLAAQGLDSRLPGYHGKGLYSGQDRLVYANNGEPGPAALRDPWIPSGALAEWRTPGEDWQLARRNQFTEVTGPGGLQGNRRPAEDPIWSVGWDARSLILMCLDRGTWQAYRLPKGSHSYDGAHGWNTEWPRIRDVGRGDWLMTMHGTFWDFPRDFAPRRSAGLQPRSNYLKVIGDFCRWQDQLVFGCDDSARSEFLNTRKAKGTLPGPARSQSNLWFVDPSALDDLGPAIGRGAVWLNEPVRAGSASDPYLFAGYAHRGLHLVHADSAPVAFRLDVDRRGSGRWENWRRVEVPATGYLWIPFERNDPGVWIRLVPEQDCRQVTAFFHTRNVDTRGPDPAVHLMGLRRPEHGSGTGGLLHAGGRDGRSLSFLARNARGELGLYEMDADLVLRPVEDPEAAAALRTRLAVPSGVLSEDAASVLYEDERGRWRLPRAHGDWVSSGPLGRERVCREVCTERDLFNAGGIFYELPAENAGGFAGLRPITTHARRITDFASYRGLLVLAGVEDDARGHRLVTSTDGQCRLWVGVVDDLWRFGKVRGVGGPWRDTPVRAGVPSDPYLMTGFDRKRVRLSHQAPVPTIIRLEIDVTGTGGWSVYRSITVPPGEEIEHAFPEAFGAYWVRAVADQDGRATAMFRYD